ncbi:MAG: HAMP domain-containing histidine kinase [Bacteriovoracaceae bacterium]|nr:HAMP domain-containing histidine kinase [Bacteriovoracaceae bacterium]
MSIKAKLLLANILMFFAALTPGWILVGSYMEMPKNLGITRSVYSLVHELTLLNNAMVDIRHRDIERAQKQWIGISDEIKGYIENLADMGVHPRYYETLRETNRLIRRLFEGVNTANIQTLDETQRNFLITQVNLKTHDMIMVGHILLSIMQEDLQAANDRATQYVLAFFVLVVVIFIYMYWFLSYSIVNPLIDLEYCVREIGKGEFDIKVPTSGNDEIGALGVAVNKMKANLKMLTKSKEEFLSTAAHELKTPITVLKTTSQLMEGMSGEELKNFLPYALSTINKQCDQLNKLVVDVLEVSKLELEKTELRVVHFSMNHLVEEVVQNMAKISEGHELEVIRNDEVDIFADRTRIEQVLVNLIDNAIKYSPNSKKIEIESKQESEKVVISVKDYGIGIAKSRQGQIFERFYRAHAGTAYEQVTSMGVGLFLSKQFVLRHGGEIKFNSVEGEGSTFFFSLPIKTEVSHGNE